MFLFWVVTQSRRRPGVVVIVIVRRDAERFVGDHLIPPTFSKVSCIMLESFSCLSAITRKENRALKGKGQFLSLVVEKGCLALLHSRSVARSSPASAEPHTIQPMRRTLVSCLEVVMHARLLNGGFLS